MRSTVIGIDANKTSETFNKGQEMMNPLNETTP